jgi:hypothetical protein
MLTNKRSIAIVFLAILSSLPALIQARGADAAAVRVAEHVVCRALFSGDGTAQVICFVAFAEACPVVCSPGRQAKRQRSSRSEATRSPSTPL